MNNGIEIIKTFRKISRKVTKYGVDVCGWNNQKLKMFFEAHEKLYLKHDIESDVIIYFLGLIREQAKNGDVWARELIISLSMHAIFTNTEHKKPIALKLKNKPLKEI